MAYPLGNMQSLISRIFKAVTQHILVYTLYHMMCSSHDFHDVKLALNDQTDRLIELFRSCFTIHLINDSYFFLLSMSFLVMAETIQVHYGRLSPAELKECAENMGYATFAILFALLDIGFVVVRIAGLVALSGTPGLAAGLILISMSPIVVLPLLSSSGKLAKCRRRASVGGDDEESGIIDDEAQS